MVLVLLLIVAAPVLLFTGFFVKQKSIQYKMNERLKKTALHTITANTADVKWIKKNKEVEVYGKMFDVKHFSINGNLLTLTGLYDEEEHELKKDLAGLMKEKKDGTTPINQLVLKFVFTEAIAKIDGFSLSFMGIADKFIYNFYNETAQSQYLAVITPPPNV